MDESLERFLGEARERLRALPEATAERRYDELSRALERAVAAEISRGRDEDEAVAVVLAHFDLSPYTSPAPDASSGADGLGKRLAALSPTATAALYSAALFFVIEVAVGWVALFVLRLIVPGAGFPAAAATGIFGYPSLLFVPSVWASVLGLAAVLLRDGPGGALRRVVDGRTAAGAGLRWILLSRVLTNALWVLFFWLVEKATGDPERYEPFLYLLIPLAAAAPFAAGWIVGRRQRRAAQAYVDVRAAAATCLVLNLANLVADYLLGFLFPVPVPPVLILAVLATVACIYAALGVAGAAVGVGGAAADARPE